MPIYEYACKRCDTQFERLRPMSDGAAADCPECGTPASRVVSLMAAPVRVGVGAGAATMPSAAGAACCGGGCCAH